LFYRQLFIRRINPAATNHINNMKKIVILIILIGQLVWTFNSGFSTIVGYSGDFERPVIVEIRGFSGVIKVVHSSFIDTLKKVIELSCLIPQLPGSENTEKDENKKNDTRQNPLYFCNQSLNLNNSSLWRIKQLVGHSLATTKNNITNSMSMSLCGLGLMTGFLLLYLYKLKFCIYTPRGSISDILNFLEISPDWVGNAPRNQLGLFYFIFLPRKHES